MEKMSNNGDKHLTSNSMNGIVDVRRLSFTIQCLLIVIEKDGIMFNLIRTFTANKSSLR